MDACALARPELVQQMIDAGANGAERKGGHL